MSQTTELITVGGIGPYGVKCGDTWYKLSKNLTTAMFVKGHTYSITVGIGQKGGKYINKIDNVLGDVKAEASGPTLDPELNKARATAVPMKYGKPMSAFEVEEGRCIRRSGLIQASIQAVASHVSKDQILPEAIKLAEGALLWVENKPVAPAPTTEPVSASV